MRFTPRNLTLTIIIVVLINIAGAIAVAALVWWAGSLLSFWELNSKTFIGVAVFTIVIVALSGKELVHIDMKR